MSFDDTFVKGFSKFTESKNYLYPIWYQPFLIGTVATEGYDDRAYTKMDFVAAQETYKNDLHVIYNKAVVDRRRKNYDGFRENIKRLGAIDKWQFCGVFENLNGSGLITDYEPELYAKNDKLFNANSNGRVGWYNPAIPQTEACHYFYNEAEYGDGIIYAQTFVKTPSARTVVISFASGEPIKIFLNDVEIYVNDKLTQSDLNAYQLQCQFKEGVNRLVVKSSIDGSADYIFVTLRDKNQQLFTDLEYSDTYLPYNKATLEEIAPNELTPDFETYFVNKLKVAPLNPLYTLLLYNAYINNHKDEQAFEVIEKLSEKYPSSSLLNFKLTQYYTDTGDDNKVEELKKNMILTDENYYLSIINKFSDSNFVRESSISEIEKYRDKVKTLLSSNYILLFDFIIAGRNSDVDLMLSKAETFLASTYNNELLTATFSTLYASLKNDKDKTVSILQNFLKERDVNDVESTLVRYLSAMNRKEDVQRIVDERLKKYPYFNEFYYDAIKLANDDNQYDKALGYSNTALKNFPYSFAVLEKKGRVYNSLKNTKEAEKTFRESLTHYSGNSALRKTLYDITKVPDEIDQVAVKDVYALIKQRRNAAVKMPSDYGINLLLDEYIVNVFPEGGQKGKVTSIYDVISEKGVELLKEYEVGGANILKAEIVKPDGSVAPAEESGSSVVFTNLKVGDVVLLQYEETTNNYGRFYKDFDLEYYLNGSYPCLQTIFGIIYPDGVNFATKVSNGTVQPKVRKLNSRNYMSWEAKQVPAVALTDNFSPAFDDTAYKVSVSTIKSWSDISNWYADLVKKNIILDKDALKAYDKLFPKGTAGINEEEIANRIYKFIEENITYSSLDFRQSGYVPQKPAKTVATKLGDCKDVSTLFVAMAERAGLKANLVLVRSNGRGVESPVLPAIDFNHCIVKAVINGKDYFIELTDRYLPFKALPVSLYRAKALEISFDKSVNEKGTLINLPFTNTLPSAVSTSCVLTIDDNSKKFVTTHTVSGAHKSYFSELFNDDTTPDIRKKEFEDSFNQKLSKVIVLEDNKLISNERFAPEMKYQTVFNVTEKLQSVGSLKIFEVPFLDNVYTRTLISTEKRNYDIKYPDYEDVNHYTSEVIINIPEGKKFAEVPKDQKLAFKNHNYSITYTVEAPNKLKVVRDVALSWDDISKNDYAVFKKYVEDVIAAEEEIIGFK